TGIEIDGDLENRGKIRAAEIPLIEPDLLEPHRIGGAAISSQKELSLGGIRRRLRTRSCERDGVCFCAGPLLYGEQSFALRIEETADVKLLIFAIRAESPFREKRRRQTPRTIRIVL